MTDSNPPAATSRAAWLAAELRATIAWYKRQGTRHRRAHYRCRFAMFSLLLGSTILAALALAYPAAQKGLNIALVATTTLLTAVAAFEAVRRPGEKWNAERRAEYALRDLERELAFGTHPADNRSDLEDVFRRFLEVQQAAREQTARPLDAASPPPNRPRDSA